MPLPVQVFNFQVGSHYIYVFTAGKNNWTEPEASSQPGV